MSKNVRKNIQLLINPSRISAESWIQFYNEAHRFLINHALRFVCRRPMFVAGAFRDSWSQQLEHDIALGVTRRLEICGDLTSYQMMEPVRIYQHVSYYQRLAVMCPPRRPAEDILLDLSEGRSCLAVVYSSRNTSAEVDRALLSLGILAENLLSYAAYLDGNIDRSEADSARESAEALLGRHLAPPVCLDSTRLWRRLSSLFDAENASTLSRSYFRGPLAEVLASVIVTQGRDRGEAWLGRELQQHPSLFGPSVQKLLLAWLNLTGDLEALLQLCCLDSRGPNFAPEVTLAAIAATWVLSDDACGPHPPTSGSDARQLTRRTLPWIPLNDAIRAIHRLLPEHAERLVAILCTEHARQKLLQEKVQHAVLCRSRPYELTDVIPHADFLLECPALGKLPKLLEQELRYFAFRVYEALETLLQRPQSGDILRGSVSDLRHRVFDLVSRRHTLTEATWRELERVEDRDILRFVYGLTMILHLGDSDKKLERALVENSSLRRSVVENLLNPAVFAGTRDEVAQLRQRDSMSVQRLPSPYKDSYCRAI